MADWWEEIINRSLLPNKSLQEVVDARLCSTRRHKEVLAKLIYHLGKYHAKYWDIAKFKNEREFVNDFLEKYV